MGRFIPKMIYRTLILTRPTGSAACADACTPAEGWAHDTGLPKARILRPVLAIEELFTNTIKQDITRKATARCRLRRQQWMIAPNWITTIRRRCLILSTPAPDPAWTILRRMLAEWGYGLYRGLVIRQATPIRMAGILFRWRSGPMPYRFRFHPHFVLTWQFCHSGHPGRANRRYDRHSRWRSHSGPRPAMR